MFLELVRTISISFSDCGFFLVCRSNLFRFFVPVWIFCLMHLFQCLSLGFCGSRKTNLSTVFIFFHFDPLRCEIDNGNLVQGLRVCLFSNDTWAFFWCLCVLNKEGIASSQCLSCGWWWRWRRRRWGAFPCDASPQPVPPARSRRAAAQRRPN